MDINKQSGDTVGEEVSAGALFAIGTPIVVPGLGLVVAGPLAAALACLGAGGATARPRDDKHAADLERDFGSYGGRNVLR